MVTLVLSERYGQVRAFPYLLIPPMMAMPVILTAGRTSCPDPANPPIMGSLLLFLFTPFFSIFEETIMI